jgi:hypothetical protein
MKKIILLTSLFLFSLPAFSQYAGGREIKADTVSIYKVGHAKDGEFACHVSWGQKSRVFKSFTITDDAGERKFFKSAKNAVKYLGGELIGKTWKNTEVGAKPVFVIKLQRQIVCTDYLI